VSALLLVEWRSQTCVWVQVHHVGTNLLSLRAQADVSGLAGWDLHRTDLSARLFLMGVCLTLDVSLRQRGDASVLFH